MHKNSIVITTYLTGSGSSVKSVHPTTAVVDTIVEEGLKVGEHGRPPVAILAVWVRLEPHDVRWEGL